MLTASWLLTQLCRGAVHLQVRDATAIYNILAALRGPDNDCPRCKRMYTLPIRAGFNALTKHSNEQWYDKVESVTLKEITALHDELDPIVNALGFVDRKCQKAEMHFLRHAGQALNALQRLMQEKEDESTAKVHSA